MNNLIDSLIVSSSVQMNGEALHMKRMSRVDHQSTKIVATVGPASKDYDMLLKLVKTGVDVFRLNFSNGSHDEHKEVIDNILKINQIHGFHTGILCDLQGPKIRIGKVEGGSVELKDGQDIIFTTKETVSNAEKVFINYKKFIDDVDVGERILLDDGMLILKVKEIIDEHSAR